MPASKHMIVIEKRRDMELRLLISGAAHECARDSQSRKASRRRPAGERRENRSASSGH